jgi:hypothetical protein
VALKKMPGVASVETSLNEGKAVIRLQPGNTLRYAAIIRKIQDQGFTPKEARVAVAGELRAVEKLQLRVTGTREVLELHPPPQAEAELRKLSGATVIVEGIIPAPRAKEPPSRLEVRSWTVAPPR